MRESPPGWRSPTHTESTTESGPLWWHQRTTTYMSATDRLPLLLIGVALLLAGVPRASGHLEASSRTRYFAAIAGANMVYQQREAALANRVQAPAAAKRFNSSCVGAAHRGAAGG